VHAQDGRLAQEVSVQSFGLLSWATFLSIGSVWIGIVWHLFDWIMIVSYHNEFDSD